MFRKINQKSCIGIISPAWKPDREQLEKGIEYLQKMGFKVKHGQNIVKSYKYFAGTNKERLSDLHEMFADPDIDLIICSRGGWGTLKLLDEIDYNLIKNNPKPLVGYSDITALQLAIWKKSKIPSLSGPMVAIEMGKGIDPFTEKHFWGQIKNNKPFYRIDLSLEGLNTIRNGNSKGILLGGCLSILTTLLGTPYCPDFNGAILFIEDIGETPYKIDRYLAHLRQAGIFNHIKGLILGSFTDCCADNNDESFTISEIFNEYFSKADFPVITNFPYGHDNTIITMPIGIPTKLNTESKELIFRNPFI